MHQYPQHKGFTLVELLVVIGVLAVLATVTVLIVNPSEYLNRAKDSQRVSDLTTVKKAVELAATFKALKGEVLDYDGPNYNPGNPSCVGGGSQKIFISVPTETETAHSPPSGWTYQQQTAANINKIDGNGWLPIDFASVFNPQSPPVSKLPIDPVNTFSSGYYYSYVCGSYALGAKMASQKFIDQYNALNENQTNIAGKGYFAIGDKISSIPADIYLGDTPTNPAPVVTGSTPNYAIQGLTGTGTINGSNFKTGATVSLGSGITVNTTTFISATALSVNITVSGGATVGPRDITVTNTDGKSHTCSSCFSVQAATPPAPTISLFNPNNAPNNGTASGVIITGTNFQAGATVKLSRIGQADISGANLNISPSSITADFNLTNALSGAWTLTVTNPDAQTATASFTITQGQQQTGYIIPSNPPNTGGTGTWTVPSTGWLIDEIPPSAPGHLARANAGGSSSLTPTVTFSGFPFNIPGGSSIDKICVNLNDVSLTTSQTNTQKFTVNLSWNNGASFLSTENTSMTDISSIALDGPEYYFKNENTVVIDPSSEPQDCTNWGRTWTASEMSQFAIRVTAFSNNASLTANLRFDVVKVNVYFTAP